VTITEAALPNFTAGSNVTYCTPLGTSVTHTGGSAPSGFALNWTTANGNITAGANTLTPSIDLSGTYTLTLSGGTGCSASENVDILVVDNPTVELGSNFIHCGTGNYSITITNPYDLVVWGDGSTGNVYTSNVGGAVDVTVHVGTCTATDQVIVTQIIPTPPVAGAAITTCTNGSINLSGTADPNYTYAWTTIDGNILSNSNTLTPTVDLTGTYTLTVTTPENCTASDAVLVTLIPIPSVTLGSNIQICPNENFVISVPNPSDYDVITWGDGSVGPSFSSSGPQTVNVTVETNGCTNTDQVVVSEYNAPSWDLGGDLTVCGDAPFSYNTGLPVTWFDGTQGTSYLNPPSGPLSATFYYGDNCPIVDNALITIIPPTPIDLGNDTTICQGTSIQLDAGVAVLWNGLTNGFSNTFEVTQPDVYTAYFTDGTCQSFDTIQVDMQLLPIITWQGEETYCNGNSVILANPNSNATEFLWSTGETTEQITVSEGNYYSLTVSNFCGSASQDILLNFEDCDAYAFIPNAFTPDQDGLNEAWQPILVNAIGYEVFIYNRWGDPIFHSIDPHENWLGETHNGEYYNQDGIYSYRLILKSPDATIKEYFGYFHLLR
jgi:gliding motility-associated-like protein